MLYNLILKIRAKISDSKPKQCISNWLEQYKKIFFNLKTFELRPFIYFMDTTKVPLAPL